MQFNSKNFFLIFIIALTVFSAAAQNTAIDSLNKVLSTAKEDTAKVNTLIRLSREYTKDTIKQKECLDKSYTLSLKLNYKQGICKTLNAYSDIARKKGDFGKAIPLLERSLKMAKEIKDTVLIATCLNSMGIISKTQGNYNDAIKYYTECIALRKEIKDMIGVAIVYSNLGNVYKNKGDYDQALLTFMQALKIFEKFNSTDRIAPTLLNIGNIYLNQKDYPTAIDYYLQSLINNNNTGKSLAYCNIGIAYTKMEMFDKSDEFLKRSLKLAQEEKYKMGIAAAFQNMGFNYMKTGKIEKALEYYFKTLPMFKELNEKRAIGEGFNYIAQAYFEQKNFNKSLEYGEKALVISKEMGAKMNILDNYEDLSKTYTKINNYEKALEYYKLSVELKDSLFSKEKIQAMAELETRYETDKKEKEIKLLTKDNELKEKEFKEQKIIRSSLIGGLILLLILSFTLYNRFRFKQKANLLLENQKKEIQQKNNQITDSIDYAKTIQEAILPSDIAVQELLPDSFIFHKPKAVVSGDFYWVSKKNNKIICAVADCTGHGVPGAFMSLLGNNLLENVINKTNTLNPAAILDGLNEEIITTLGQSQEKSSIKHGMDIALITIDKNTGQLEYAGAHNSLYRIRQGELTEIKADKMPIGSSSKNAPVKFTNHTLDIQKDDFIYMFSDGYPDQIGGLERKKFFYQPFKDLLLSIHQLEMAVQKKKLDEAISTWKGEHNQTDDILVMGIRC